MITKKTYFVVVTKAMDSELITKETSFTKLQKRQILNDYKKDIFRSSYQSGDSELITKETSFTKLQQRQILNRSQKTV